MRQEREKATSSDVKAALLDGFISDQEYAEMKQRYTACLEVAGIAVTKYGFEGAVLDPPSTLPSDEVHRTEARCSGESGEFPIAYFYVQMRVNPSHNDLAPAIVECFKRSGVVGPSYGLKDYRSGDLPSTDQPAVTACNTDPEGRLGR